MTSCQDTGPIVIFTIMFTVFGCILLAMIIDGRFSQQGRMERRWNTEMMRRASQFAAIGIQPEEARRRATNEMREEAESVLKLQAS